MAARVTIIIPTYNNPRMLLPCVRSITDHTRGVDYDVLIVNNGEPGGCDALATDRVVVLDAGVNLRWEGGLAYGVARTTSPLMLFLNDDTLILARQADWLARLAGHFAAASVGAAGPASNFACGWQDNRASYRMDVFDVPLLSGFCLLVRREAWEAAGGSDLDLPLGDDIDLSLRLADAGYRLVVDRRVYVHHFGCIASVAVQGAANTITGYNSPAWAAAIAAALVAKHGRERIEALHFYSAADLDPPAYLRPAIDAVLSRVRGQMAAVRSVLEPAYVGS